MKILITEKEKGLRTEIVNLLTSEAYGCDVAPDPDTAMKKCGDIDYDCILLDMSGSRNNGLAILKELKKSNRQDNVIIISANNTFEERIQWLSLGVDNYLAKPFHLAELSARIAVMIRRNRFGGSKVLTAGTLSIDTEAKTAFVKNTVVDVTRKEYDLLLYLMMNKNRILPKSTIADYLASGYTGNFENFDFIYSHIKNLKRKLSRAGSEDFIRSVYGMGYRFECLP